MENNEFKMRMSDGSEKDCIIIAEFDNETNGKHFAFYTFKEQLEKDECEIHTVLKTKNESGYTFEQITDKEDLDFAQEMFNSLNELIKEETENGTVRE